MSLARAHRERAAAEAAALRAAADGDGVVVVVTSEQELMRARLGVDLRRLREIESIERKVALKAELIPAYDPWVEGILAADTGAADDVLIQVMIWAIDTGDMVRAMPMIRYVLGNGLDLPDRFTRSAPTMIVEEIADNALKALGQDQTPDVAMLLEIDTLATDFDVFDEVRAKLEKAIGLSLARHAESLDADADGPAGQKHAGLVQAEARLKRALELNANSGVKKKIEQIAAQLKKLPPPAG